MDRREDSHVGRYDQVSFENAVWLRRRFTVPRAAAGRPLFLRLTRPPWYFKLFVNGVQVVGHGLPHPTKLGDANHTAPGVIQLAAKTKGVTFLMYVFSQGCSRKENFLYRLD